MKIIENVYVVPDVSAHTYLIVEPDGLTLIDTGLPRSEKKIVQYIASLGKSAGDLKRILITHADLDHYGCLANLQKASGARTHASQVEAEAMAEGQSARPINRHGKSMRRFLIWAAGLFGMKAAPIRVDEILRDGQVLPILGGLQVLSTPGHSPDHLSFFSPSAGVLFCGDSMSSSENGSLFLRSSTSWAETRAGESVRRQRDLQPRIVCPGHGPVVYDAPEKFPQSA